VSDVKESVSESGFERADALRVRVHTRKFNAILGSCGVSRTAQSFFESMPEDVICPDQTWTLGLCGSRAGFWTVLGDMSSSGHKKDKACCQCRNYTKNYSVFEREDSLLCKYNYLDKELLDELIGEL